MVTAVGDVVVLVDDVEVVLATIEELTASAVVTLTGDTVVDDTGTSDVDTVVILDLKPNVALTTDSVCGVVRTVRRVVCTPTVVEDFGEVGKRAPVAVVVVVVVVAVVVAVVGLLRVEVGG